MNRRSLQKPTIAVAVLVALPLVLFVVVPVVVTFLEWIARVPASVFEVIVTGKGDTRS